MSAAEAIVSETPTRPARRPRAIRPAQAGIQHAEAKVPAPPPNRPRESDPRPAVDPDQDQIDLHQELRLGPDQLPAVINVFGAVLSTRPVKIEARQYRTAKPCGASVKSPIGLRG